MACNTSEPSKPATPATPLSTTTQQPRIDVESKNASRHGQYNSESWKSIVPPGCNVFFDGCNNCTRVDQKEAACTRKACVNYEKPKCLDKPTPMTTETTVSCDNGQKFTLYYGEYYVANQRVKLGDNQLAMSDLKNLNTSILTQVPAASGSKYSNTHFEYWGKGNEAMITIVESNLVLNCQK